MQRLCSAELARTHGIRHAKAAQIKAALEIARRLLLAEPPQRGRVGNPSDIAALLMHEMSQLPQEHLRVVLLNTRAEVLGIETVVIGSIDHAEVRVADVFRDALRVGAASMVLAHNHPSGDPTPSPEDWTITHMLVEAGHLLGLPIRDHHDCVQSVFMLVWHHIRTFDYRGEQALVAWLYKIARNLVIDELRRRPRQTAVSLTDELADRAPGVPDHARTVCDRMMLKDALMHLNRDQQLVVSWRYGAGLSHGDVGRVMQRSEGAISCSITVRSGACIATWSRMERRETRAWRCSRRHGADQHTAASHGGRATPKRCAGAGQA